MSLVQIYYVHYHFQRTVGFYSNKTVYFLLNVVSFWNMLTHHNDPATIYLNKKSNFKLLRTASIEFSPQHSFYLLNFQSLFDQREKAIKTHINDIEITNGFVAKTFYFISKTLGTMKIVCG